MKKINTKRVSSHAKRLLLGNQEKKGLLSSVAIYFLLVIISFIYLYPMLNMFVTSFKSLSDLLNDSVKWIPTTFFTDNYKRALEVMKFSETFLDTLELSLIPALLQVVVASFTGYAFAQYKFRGKFLMFGILILTFVLPRQATMMPTYLLFKEMNIIGTINAFTLPAMLGQGINSTIIILVFYIFYQQISASVVEAAKLDGCGHMGVFFRIAIPSAVSAFLIGFLFSFVWYWNETYLTSLYVAGAGLGNDNSMSTLLLELSRFEASYKMMYPDVATSVNRINEAIRMAGTMLCVSPLLIVYFVLQRYFVQSVDMLGIKD